MSLCFSLWESPSIPSGLWRKGLILCHIRDVRRLYTFPRVAQLDWRQKWDLNPDPSDFKSRALGVHSFMSLPPSSMAATKWSQLRSLPSDCFPFMENEQILFFFLFPPCSPFIHQNRKKCLLCAKWCDWHWLNFVQRNRSSRRDWPQNSFTTQGQRCSKKVATVFMFIFLFFLSFSFGCAILNAESYFPNQESNLCPFIGGSES